MITSGPIVIGQNIGYDVKDGGSTPYDAVCPSGTVMTGLRNITNGDYFTLLCR